ncbi:MAG: hypothetical protein C4320_09810 [Armatimonadota bacterium]
MPMTTMRMEGINAPSLGEARCLSDVLCASAPLTFSEIAPLASNVRAIEAALQFVAGTGVSAAIVGPSGWGKSRILAAAGAVATRLQGMPVPLHSADAPECDLARLDETPVLVLDDSQSVLPHPRRRLALRRALESRQRRGRSTLLAFTASHGCTLRDLRDLLGSSRGWTIASIDEPRIVERRDLLHHLALREDLRLSETLVNIIAREMAGNGRTLVGALRRLRLERREWIGSRGTLAALGLLDPFFADSTAWDLRHRIARTAEQTRCRFPSVAAFDLAAYTMLIEAGLCERAVADYFGREPAVVYSAAASLRRAMDTNPEVSHLVERFVASVVDTLSS